MMQCLFEAAVGVMLGFMIVFVLHVIGLRE